jgi:hypothetical protein
MSHNTEIVEAGVGVEREGDKASCGDKNTGSETVYANGHGITRVGYLDNLGPDYALNDQGEGGRIIGPGTQNVFIENWRISLPGDAIVLHGTGEHAGAITANESTDVFVDSGFLDPYGLGTVEAPDLEVVDLYVTYGGVKYSALHGGATFYTSGLDYYAPLSPTAYDAAWNHCHVDPSESTIWPGWGGLVPRVLGWFSGKNPAPLPSTYLHGITYTIKNVGTHDSPPFKVGKWKLPTYAQNPNYIGSPVTLIMYDGITEENYWKDLNIKLLGETQVEGLKPGETFTDTFIPYSTTNPLKLSDGHYWFAVFPDIYGEVLEPHENNGFKAIKLTMNNGCGF